MSAHLDAGWRLAAPQDNRDRAASLGVIDMDRQKTAFVVMRVEQRQLLMLMHDIASVVDVEASSSPPCCRRAGREPCPCPRLGKSIGASSANQISILSGSMRFSCATAFRRA